MDRDNGQDGGDEQSIFGAQSSSPQSNSTVTLLNNEQQKERKMKEQQAKESRFKLTFAVRGSHREVPSGCSRWLQLFWPDYLARTELQSGEQKGTGRRERTKGKKTKQALKMGFAACRLLILNLVNNRKLQNKTVTHSGHLGKGNQLPLGIRHRNFSWPLYGFIISAMPGFL